MYNPIAIFVLRPVRTLFSRATRSAFAQRHLAPHLSRLQMWLYRRSGGRFQLSALLVPTLILISRGARTGLRRETPLMCWPLADGSFYVAGSNWGRPEHPAWTTNLIAHPEIEIIRHRRVCAGKAHLLDGAERDAAWPVLEAQWPGYRDYEKTADRPMRIFRLVPGEQVS
jgi:deazaflavin-dependent oxidoreductase (nitroreductase family)